MLDSETKRRIDTARDILVGKIPDPKSQVEQITIALIYKFMDDMDNEAVEMGGKRRFFVGEFEKYAWTKIFDPRLGGFEMLGLYSDAITRMTQNTKIPQLFRDIFKNAYLPYRDPETLKLFLKTINEFKYDHSERLGDAFEYLLSVLGSQGDAGQFRTPRHIIDFMTAVIKPQKTDTVLDPACGTAGFLISAYKHIMAAHRKKNALNPEEHKRVLDNIKGYDISPDMVRLSLVNLYLHGFVQPHIFEYDTLSSEDRWNEYADVILANPPFMSPKGGIMPHKKFTVQSNRSEVLFVDYIAEHLTPTGRAAVIVPEGIIFKSAGAYKQLRKMLVEDRLFAVVSLPAGVFNPYSGVKTSILFMDRRLARKADSILFVKVEKDGYGLGAQRRPLCSDNGDKPELCPQHSDLPAALTVIDNYIKAVRADKIADFDPTTLPGGALVVSKATLAESGDYNLTGDRYRAVVARSHQKWQMVELKEICSFEYGKSLPEKSRTKGPYPVMGSNGRTGFHNEYLIEGPAIIIGRKGSSGEVVWEDENCFPIDTTYYVKANTERIDFRWLFHILKNLNLKELSGGAGIPGLNRNDAYCKEIPLPPLEVQRAIVAEIEGYQKIIDGARQVVEHYKPHIDIDPTWPMVKLGDAITLQRGYDLPKTKFIKGKVPVVGSNGTIGYHNEKKEKGPGVVTGRSGTIGKVHYIDSEYYWPHNTALFVKEFNSNDKYFIKYLLESIDLKSLGDNVAAVPSLDRKNAHRIIVPLPPLKVQREIVAAIDAERKAVESCRNLIALYEAKIKRTIDKVWEA